MAIPIILGVAAAVAGAAGITLGIRGGAKMVEANETAKAAQRLNEKNIDLLKDTNESAIKMMDTLGNKELAIIASFDEFFKTVDKIHNRPDSYEQIGEADIPKYSEHSIREFSVLANVALSSLAGASLGTAGGIAASGATVSTVAMFGTASTGTAISGLSGVAATNATLAALGGGSLAAGGGGVALGTTILGATTLGVGLLVGGAILSFSGSSMEEKADKLWDQMVANERKVKESCKHLNEIKDTANKYYQSLCSVEDIYKQQLQKTKDVVNKYLNAQNRCDWLQMSDEEALVVKNTCYVMKVLRHMCEVKLLQNSEQNSEIQALNHKDINASLAIAEETNGKFSKPNNDQNS